MLHRTIDWVLWATYYVHLQVLTSILQLIPLCYQVLTSSALSPLSPRQKWQKLWQKYFLPCFSPSCGRNTFLPGRKPTLTARSFWYMTLARVDNTPCKKTGEISLDLSEMHPVNVVTLLMCHLKRPLRYGGYLCNQMQRNNVEMC